MSDRTASYTFKGNFTNLGAGLTTMGKGVNDLGLKLTALDKQGAVARRGLTTIGSTAGKAGLLAAAGVAAIVVSAANFDQAMSKVQAATGASTDGLDELRAAAIKAGAATVFSATEAADAITAMSKAGVSATDILAGGLDGALALASAGELDVATAADIAATAMNQFGLAGKDIPHIADLLAAGAASAQGEVTDFATALKYVGPVAHQMGISIEETTGVIAELASQGVLADQAGTSLRGMLTALTSPSVMAAKEMKTLGINLYDATGQFIGFDGVAGQLHDTLGGLTNAERDQALGRIFGNEQITAARILYAGGADAVAKWTDAVDKDGAAADIAATKLNNLRGDLEQLKGSLETAFIGAGEGSQGGLRSLVQGATSAVNAFNKVPGPVQATVTALLGLTAITGGGLWLGSKAVSGVTSLKQALDDLSVSGTKTGTALSRLAKAGVALAALEAAGLIMQGIDKAAAGAAPNVERLTGALIDANNADFANEFGDLQGALDAIDPSGVEGLANSLDDLGAKGGGVGTAVTRGLGGLIGLQGPMVGTAQQVDKATQAFDSLDQALAGLVASGGPDRARQAFDALAASQGLSSDQQKQLLGLLPQYQDALAGTANEAKLAGTATDGLTVSTDGVSSAAQDAAQNIADLVKNMQDQADAAVAAFDAITGYRQAMKDADAQAKKSNAGINGNSDAALKNRDALSGLISHWNSLDQTVTDNVGKFKSARQNFLDTAAAMKVPEAQAKALWQEMAKIPSSKVIPVTTPGMDDATNKAKTLKQILDSIHSKDINIALHYQTLGNKPHPTTPGEVPDRVSAGRSSTGLNLIVPRTTDLSKDAEAKALLYLAKQSGDAGGAAKTLKERLHDAEQRLTKFSKAADDAHTALDSLKSQRSDLSSSVSGALTHDAFSGSLDTFNAQTSADAADAQAELAALQTLVANGLDPHSDLFKRLAASGNVALIQQFAALTRDQLAGEAAQFAAGQSALNAVGSFAGQAAFGDLISAQTKTTHHLDNVVHDLAQTVKHLTAEVQHMGKNVKDGAKEGARAGSYDGTWQGAKDGISGRDRLTAAGVRTGGPR